MVSHVVPAPPRFCDIVSPRLSPENDDMDVDMGTLRHHRNVGRHDRWTSGICTIAVPGDDGHDPCSALSYAETGNTSVINGVNAMTKTNAGTGHPPAAVGFFRVRESPQTMTIESLPLGRSGKMESRLMGFPATEQRHDAGHRRCEVEEGNGKDGKRGERRSRSRPDTATYAGINSTVSGGGDSSSVSQRAGSVENDRVKGACFFHHLVSGSLFVS